VVDDQARQVLEAVGFNGADPERLARSFPGYDVAALERDGYLEIRRLGISETGDSGRFDSGDSDSYYALTPRGAEAIGIDPRLLD